MMALLDLPLEVIYLIVDCLELDSDISALSRTTRWLHPILIKYLYNRNAKSYNCSALEWAARYGEVSVARNLLESGAPIFLDTPWKWQPIWLATMNGHDKVVRLFLEWGSREKEQEAEAAMQPTRSSKDKAYRIGERSSIHPTFDYKSFFAGQEDPVELAFQHGKVGVARVLLEYGAMNDWLQRDVNYLRSKIILGDYPCNCEILSLLAEKFPFTIDFTIQEKERFLCHAVDPDVIVFLIESGALADLEGVDGEGPLFNAIEFGDLRLVQLLIEAGACPKAERHHQVTLSLLRFAAEIGELEIARWLLEHVNIRRSIEAGGHERATLLLTATICGLADIVEWILRTGCHPDERCGPLSRWFPEVSRTPLSWAVQQEEATIATLLLNSGADPNNVKPSELSPLFIACESGNIELATLLLKHKADVHCHALYGVSILSSSLQYPAILEMLLAREAGPVIHPQNSGFDPMTLAIRSGNIPAVQKLLDWAAPPLLNETPTGKKRNLIFPASLEGVRMLDFLRPHGVKPIPGDYYTESAMRHVVIKGDFATVEYLLKKGVAPDSTDPKGPFGYGNYALSNLFHAVQIFDAEAAVATVEVLLDHGASIKKLDESLEDCDDISYHPFSLTIHNLQVFHLLLRRGANPLPENKFGASVLEAGVRMNIIGAIDLVAFFAENREISLADIHRNLLLVEMRSLGWRYHGFPAAGYALKVWRRVYWRKRHPVPK